MSSLNMSFSIIRIQTQLRVKENWAIQNVNIR